MKYKIIYIAYLVFWNFSLVAIDAESVHLGGLSPRSYGALKAASNSNHYLINVLQRFENGRRQNIILVGESHEKTDLAGEEGSEIIRNFNVIGIEELCASSKKLDDALKYTAAGRILRKPAKVGIPMKGIPQAIVDKLAAEQNCFNYGSSKNDVVSIYEKGFENASNSEIFLAKLLQSFERNFDNLSAVAAEPTPVSYMDSQLKEYLNLLGFSGDFIIDINSLPQMIFLVRKKLMANRLDIFTLEQDIPEGWKSIIDSGYKKKLGLKIFAGCAIGSVLTTAASYVCSKNYPLICLNTLCVTTASVALLYINGKLNPILPKKMTINEVSENLVIRAQGQRDIIMVEAILRALRIRPELEYLPVIIGMAHNEGIKSILNQHSFKEIPLEALDPMRGSF